MLKNFFSNILNGLAYGHKNLWLKPYSNQKLLMFNHISSLVQNSPHVETCLQNPFTIFVPFEDWPCPSPISVASFHQVA
jgi:hypothetical protein